MRYFFLLVFCGFVGSWGLKAVFWLAASDQLSDARDTDIRPCWNLPRSAGGDDEPLLRLQRSRLLRQGRPYKRPLAARDRTERRDYHLLRRHHLPLLPSPGRVRRTLLLYLQLRILYPRLHAPARSVLIRKLRHGTAAAGRRASICTLGRSESDDRL